MNLDTRFEWYWRVIGSASSGYVVATAICETEDKLDEFHDAMQTMPGVRLVETVGPFARRRIEVPA